MEETQKSAAALTASGTSGGTTKSIKRPRPVGGHRASGRVGAETKTSTFQTRIKRIINRCNSMRESKYTEANGDTAKDILYLDSKSPAPSELIQYQSILEHLEQTKANKKMMKFIQANDG